MSKRKVKPVEIVDALAGGAETELECRVAQAVRGNPTAAWHYRRWDEFMRFVDGQVAPTREMAARVRRNVMGRLPEQAAARANWIDAPEAVWPGGRWQRLVWRLAPRDRQCLGPTPRRHPHLRRLAAALAMMVALYGGKIYWRANHMVAARGVTGVVTAVVLPRGLDPFTPVAAPGAREVESQKSMVQSQQIEAGRYLRFPVRLTAGADGSADFDLPGGVRLRLEAGAEVVAQSRDAASQRVGIVTYRTAADARSLTARVPQGRVVAGPGAVFQIDARDAESAYVHVDAGRVLIVPNAGVPLEVVAAERALLTAIGAERR